MTTTTNLSLALLAPVLVLGWATAPLAWGQQAPPAAQNEPKAQVGAALESARAELAALRQRIATETAALNERVEQETKTVSTLSQEAGGLQDSIVALQREQQTTEDRLDTLRAERDQLQQQIDMVGVELRAQTTELLDRFDRTLFAAEHPSWLASIRTLHEDSTSPLDQRVATLAQLLDGARRAGSTSSRFEARVELKSAGGAIRETPVLRLGLLGGFYADPKTGDAGYISGTMDAGGFFAGLSQGLTSAQREQVARTLEDPSQGGLMPLDVSGGAGFAALGTQDTLLIWFERGGHFMWPLLFLAILTVGLMLERAITIFLKSLATRRHIGRVLDLVARDDVQGATAYAERIGGATGRVLFAALVHADRDRSIMEDAVQEALLHHAPSFTARLSFIALASAVAPLIGLLGTVTGMITTFKAVTIFGTSDPQFMAGGISEALVATQGGLCLAIPSLVVCGVLTAFAHGALSRLEAGAMSLVLALLRLQEKARERKKIADQMPEPPSETDVPFSSRGHSRVLADGPTRS